MRWAVLIVAGLAGAAALADEPATTQAVLLIPGQETQIDDPALGGAGHYVVYVPSDYTGDRAWPVIFCYHGLGRPPGVWPFKDATDGRGFIVVGMEYVDADLGAQNPQREVESLLRIGKVVAGELRVDGHRRFIGGFGQGGWVVSELAERSGPIWAGVVILGAGRDAAGNPKNYRGKPIFLGAGEKDPNIIQARQAAEYYRGQGAEVTLAEYAGIGTTVEPADARLRVWLKSLAGVANNR